MNLIELINVTVTFRRAGRPALRALDGVSFAVPAGATLGVVGESGSGKSTAAAVALGLRRPASGEVRFDGRPLSRRRTPGDMQAVLQHPVWALNPHLTAGRSIAEPLLVAAHTNPAFAGIRRAARRALVDERVAETLEAVRLDPALACRLPHELSGGQRQRVSIARALITRPRFLVFDEAVSALDVSVQADVLALIRALQREHGFASLFITHDLAVVRCIADHLCVMRAGRVVELTTAEAFTTGPTHPYSRTLLEHA